MSISNIVPACTYQAEALDAVQYSYWNIGKTVIEYEQVGLEDAEYGKQLLKILSKESTRELGKGFSRSNLKNMRSLYLNYPICQSLFGKLSFTHYCELFSVSDKNARDFYEKEAINSNWSANEDREIVVKLNLAKMI